MDTTIFVLKTRENNTIEQNKQHFLNNGIDLKVIDNSCEKKKTVKISDAWPLMDVCGKCYCPINTKTYLVHTKCPDTPSKW